MIYVYVHDVQCVGSIYLKNLSGSFLRFTYKFFQKPRMKKNNDCSTSYFLSEIMFFASHNLITHQMFDFE